MPIKSGEIESIEKLQYDFFKKIPELKQYNYWEALRKMQMNSLQRRMERYRVIYTWKVLEGLVPNCGIEIIKDSVDSRKGRMCRIPPTSKKNEAIREQSFQVNGP